MNYKIKIFIGILALSSSAQAQQLPTIYDPARDPAADLRIALTIAQAKKQNVIIDIGGDWCIDCRRLDAFLEANPTINNNLKNNLVFFKVYTGSENSNSSFFSKYPRISWVPSFLMLDSTGKIIEVIDTRQLTTFGTFSKSKFNRFITKWGTK